MPMIEITPELIEKNHWRYQQTIRKITNERITEILKYANFDAADLAVFLNIDIKTAKRYMKDFTRMPVKKIWLLSRLLNVRLDCFSDIGSWQNLIIDNIAPPKDKTGK